jgi:DNA-binding NarL/FixJ family response regulator
MNKNINVLIADDYDLFRCGLKEILLGFEFVDKVYEAEDGIDVLKIIDKKESKVDLIILDIRMPNLNGFETIKQVRKTNTIVKIIVLTMIVQEKVMAQMLKEDINGFLLKNASKKQLEETIITVIKKGHCFTEEMIRVMHQAYLNKKYIKESKNFIKISSRENEILDLLCKENTTQEIAKWLCISPRTVEVHKKNLMDKTQTRNTISLILYAIKNGLVEYV